MLPIWSRSIPRPTSVEALLKHRSTLGRQSIDMLVACRLRVTRVAINILTDALVDVSVEVRYKIHHPKKRPPGWTIPSQAVEQVVKFILNVAEEQALLLPGRVPGFKRTGVRLLPSALTKHHLWMNYTGICTSQGQQSAGYSKFCDLWTQLCPFILIMRPATDLGWTSQKNNNLIQKSANLPENQKVEAVRIQEEHLRLAAGERDFYKDCCRESKESVQQHLLEIDFTRRREPCSYQGMVHYSYDYA